MRKAATVCPPPSVTLIFDLLTFKMVSESRVTWATSLPILVFLGLSVLDLRPDVRDRQTDIRQHHRLMPLPRGGGIIIRVVRATVRLRVSVIACKQTDTVPRSSRVQNWSGSLSWSMRLSGGMSSNCTAAEVAVCGILTDRVSTSVQFDDAGVPFDGRRLRLRLLTGGAGGGGGCRP